MRLAGFVAIAALILTPSGPAQAQTPQAPPPQPIEPWPFPAIHDDPLLDPMTATRLEPFAGTDAYRDWLKQVQAYASDRYKRVAAENQRRYRLRQQPGVKRMAYLQDAEGQEICTDPECLGPEGAEQSIVVTGSRIGGASKSAASPARASRPSSGPNITNVQTAGVDEGDVVKQIGDYLAVLQDGRIFVVDIRRNRLRLSDRANVYTSKADGAWYDEMLVEGDRIIVTAYSYSRSATEITVFKLNQANGKLTRDGRFYLSSFDYYSGENYASRIIGDKLVLYTLYHANLITGTSGPRIWRWTSAQDRRDANGRLPPEARAQGRSLIDTGSVYRPVLRTSNPMVHVVTICPLGTYQAGEAPECQVSAFAGPAAREFFVSTEAVYLWMGQPGWQADDDWQSRRERCQRSGVAADAVAPAAVYRVPVDGSAPTVAGMRGQPIDQFSMDMTKDKFRILTRWREQGCYNDAPEPTLAYLNIPLGEFANRFRTVPAERHVRVPAPAAGTIENRFADDWLVYGGRLRGYGAVPDKGKGGTHVLTVLPVDQPQAPQRLGIPHNVIRIERVGADRMAVGGYRDSSGLDLSLLQLGGEARVADTARFDGRFESEGRSHAFNSLVEEDGSGILGLPTVQRKGRAMRYVWNSQGSDVSFLKMSRSGKLTDAGSLEQVSIRPSSGYSCEVSCIDWYGNSRPIFTNGRIFALMATEIAEGRMHKDGIEEIRRVDLTAPTRVRIGKSYD